MRSLKEFMSIENFNYRKNEKRKLREDVLKEEYRNGLF